MKRRIDFSNYLFRCHAVGKLMTGVNIGLTENQEKMFQDFDARYKGEGRPLTEKQTATYFELGAKKAAKPELSQTAKSYLNELHRAEFFGRTNDITSRYIDKGLMVEAKAMSLYSTVMDRPEFKNKQRAQNEFITGIADNVSGGKVRDLKSSFSLESYPLYDDKITNQLYYWQLQGYMDLFEVDDAELIYCLVDTPTNLIEDELRRMGWKHNLLTFSQDSFRDEAIPLVVETIQNHIFSREGLEKFCHDSSMVYIEWFEDFAEILPQFRVKIFELQKDEKAIKAMYEQIGNAREYLNSLSEGVADHLKIEL